MPRISDAFTDISVYVYQSVSDAESGARQGGSGFLVEYLFQNGERAHVYAVTNLHVIVKAGNPVLRLNDKMGGVKIIQTQRDAWLPASDGYDIAIHPLLVEFDQLKYWTIPMKDFVNLGRIEDEDIGIGDDTVMVGRFISHEGIQQNRPTVRFGNIAMMPGEGILNRDTGAMLESFLVETRSLPGYSGSPVFIYSPCAMNDMSVRRFGKDKIVAHEGRADFNRLKELFRAKGPYLLGIDWCHLPSHAMVRTRDGSNTQDGWYIEENTGMAGVIPAWRILALLEQEEMRTMRKQIEEKLASLPQPVEEHGA